MGAIENCILENRKSMCTWKKYKELLKKNNIDEKFNVIQEYENFYIDMKKKYPEKEVFDGLHLFTVTTFKGQVSKWKADSKRGFAIEPTNGLYIVLVAFLSKFNAEETNELLEVAGLEKLHGRNPEMCVYIYCLNQGIPYNECIFEYKQKAQERLTAPEPEMVVGSWETLEKYIEKNKLLEQENAALWNMSDLTESMTEAVMSVNTDNELWKYINDNVDNFREYRESGRRRIAYIFGEYAEENNFIQKQQIAAGGEKTVSEYSFREGLRLIWYDFEEFYHNFTTFNIREDMDLQKIDKGDNIETDSSQDGLIQILQGAAPVKRKLLILFCVFAGYEEEYIDEICLESGFNVLDNDYKTLFDSIVLEIIFLKKGGRDTKEFLSAYLYTFYLVKVYEELKKQKKKIGKVYQTDNAKKMHGEIVENLLDELDAIPQVTGDFYEECYRYAQLFVVLEKIMMYSEQLNPEKVLEKIQKDLKKRKKAAVVWEKIEKIKYYIEKVMEYRGRIDSEKELEKIQDALKSNKELDAIVKRIFEKVEGIEKLELPRNNPDYSKFIENPLYLQQKVDYTIKTNKK